MNNLNIPPSIAMEHRIIPVIDPLLLGESEDTDAIMLRIKPIPAKGIFSQFKAPRQGKNPIKKPIIETIPKIKLNDCIKLL